MSQNIQNSSSKIKPILQAHLHYKIHFFFFNYHLHVHYWQNHLKFRLVSQECACTTCCFSCNNVKVWRAMYKAKPQQSTRALRPSIYTAKSSRVMAQVLHTHTKKIQICFFFSFNSDVVGVYWLQSNFLLNCGR